MSHGHSAHIIALPLALTPGTRLGVYEVVASIGEGGMGQVFRARDTRLDRDVAIKILPEAFAHDADRLARFQREAKTLASLNHPNIAAIHGLEESGGVTALVMELVDGDDLSQRIARSAIPIDEALPIAKQIAEALEAAHEQGVIHRDLKPANIKLRADRTVKVLDFGLAKVMDRPELTASTVTVLHTGVGMVLGTPAYMSPEQARGEAVGRQSDIWSFGVVLYELLTGMSPFARPTTAETLAQVLGAQPDLTRVPTQTPPGVVRLLGRCLEKDSRRRLQHIGDARIEIEDASASTAQESSAAAQWSPWRIGMALGAVAALALAGSLGWIAAKQRTSAPAPSIEARVSLPFVDSRMLAGWGTSHLAISPDGSTVAFAGLNRMWLRRLDQKEAVAIGVGYDPFFSPDGRWLGLFAEQSLVRIPVGGGEPIVLTKYTGRPLGASWHDNGTIVFATTDGLYRVAIDGGAAELVKAPNRQEKQLSYGWPEFLPDGSTVIFTVMSDDPRQPAQIATIDLSSRDVRVVWSGGSMGRYISTGHLVFASRSTLQVAAFDPDMPQVASPVTVPNVDAAYFQDNGAADFAVSASGTLVFLPARSSTGTLQWIDRSGTVENIAVEPRGYVYARISPDGTRVALDIAGANRDIWILDLQRLALARLSDGPTEDLMPVWTPDGRRVLYSSNRAGNFDIYSQPADGAAAAKVEYAGTGDQMVQTITPDGTHLLVQENFVDTSILDLAKPDRLEPFMHTKFDDRLAQVSPDGKWFAYESDESGGQHEIMLRSFPDPSLHRAQISRGGGRYPVWGGKSTNELYYVTLDGAMMAVPIALEPELKVGIAKKLFDFGPPPAGRSGSMYDVAPTDGRFLRVARVSDDARATQVSVVLNWQEELKRLVPTN